MIETNNPDRYREDDIHTACAARMCNMVSAKLEAKRREAANAPPGGLGLTETFAGAVEKGWTDPDDEPIVFEAGGLFSNKKQKALVESSRFTKNELVGQCFPSVLCGVFVDRSSIARRRSLFRRTP